MHYALALLLVVVCQPAQQAIKYASRPRRTGIAGSDPATHSPLKTAPCTLRPGFIRRDINAVTNAARFGGGIHGVGSNPTRAGNLIDGDRTTYWSPDPSALLEDWWIEIDLGRARCLLNALSCSSSRAAHR